MELSEWIINKKEEDKTFTQKKMSEHLGISQHSLVNIIRGRHKCSIETALAIEKYTKGQVKAWDLMLKAYNRKLKEKKEEKQDE